MARTKAERRKEGQRRIGDRVKRKKLLLEVREEAAEFAKGIRRDADPAEAVQTVVDRIYDLYDYATQKVMELDEDDYWQESMAGSVAHPWIREQERLGLQLVHVAGKAAGMGLAERQVRMQEAQAAIFASVVNAALEAAGLPPDVRTAVHTQIALRLEDIDSTARELTA